MMRALLAALLLLATPAAAQTYEATADALLHKAQECERYLTASWDDRNKLRAANDAAQHQIDALKKDLADVTAERDKLKANGSQ